MIHLRRNLIALLVAFAMVAGIFSPLVSEGLNPLLGITTAEAQAKKKKRRSLFNILFGKRKASKKSKARRNAKRRTKKARRKKSRKKIASGLASTPALSTKVEKSETAKKVLVIGDFFARGMASGLDKAFQGNSNVVFVNKGNGNSGFVRTDVVNWPETVAALNDEIKPAYIITMLGTNDRQLLVEDGKKLKKRTPEWDSAYQKRLQTMGAALKKTGVPFVWMGLPPVRFNSMSRDFLVFNEWFNKAATEAGGKFIDIWDGFSDADGGYSRSGPDVNGQIVLLRGKDGINLTKAGRRRLAFYVEGQIKSTIGGGTNLFASTLDGFEDRRANKPKEKGYDPAGTGKTIVIDLNGTRQDGDLELAGGDVAKSAINNLSEALQIPSTGEKTARSGRVDNYAWPPVGGELAQGQSAVAVK